MGARDVSGLGHRPPRQIFGKVSVEGASLARLVCTSCLHTDVVGMLGPYWTGQVCLLAIRILSCAMLGAQGKPSRRLN